jgi:hypothetical protein
MLSIEVRGILMYYIGMIFALERVEKKRVYGMDSLCAFLEPDTIARLYERAQTTRSARTYLVLLRLSALLLSQAQGLENASSERIDLALTDTTQNITGLFPDGLNGLYACLKDLTGDRAIDYFQRCERITHAGKTPLLLRLIEREERKVEGWLMEQTIHLETLDYYLGELNKHWQRFDKIERGQIVFLSKLERLQALRTAETSYSYAELALAKLGWRWDQLDYDQETKTYSFPEGGEARWIDFA